MASWLDKDGVSYLWGKFKSYFSTHVQTDVPANAVFTDTTYSDFTGTDGTAAGASGLVPAPATTDANKVLYSDGTWTKLINIYNVPTSAYSLTSGSYGGFSYMAQVDITNIVPQTGETVIALIPRGGGQTNNVTVKLGGTGQSMLYIFTATSSKPNVDIVTIKTLTSS